MRREKYEEIEEQVPIIVNYPKEVEYVEAFLDTKGLEAEKMTVIFWNHLITLFERVDEGEQNEMDLSDADELSKEAQDLSKEFEVYMQTYRSFELTEFENYLMQIHFEQILKGEQENE
jgi:hypothetical protein